MLNCSISVTEDLVEAKGFQKKKGFNIPLWLLKAFENNLMHLMLQEAFPNAFGNHGCILQHFEGFFKTPYLTGHQSYSLDHSSKTRDQRQYSTNQCNKSERGKIPQLILL